MKLAYLMCVAMVIATSGAAAGPAGSCSSELHPGAVIADERFNDSVVSFVRVAEVIDVGDGTEAWNEIKVIRFRDGSGCVEEEVALYGYGGGEPTLEDAFMHTVQGEPNLFAIVSWPLLHVGLGMNGRLYSVYAYHEVDGVLAVNDLVVKNKELYGGVEGILEGEPSTFEGKTEEGVVAMLERLGLE